MKKLIRVKYFGERFWVYQTDHPWFIVPDWETERMRKLEKSHEMWYRKGKENGKD